LSKATAEKLPDLLNKQVKREPTMALYRVYAEVVDDGDKRTFDRVNVSDLSEYEGLINMSRSYKGNGRPRKYKYKLLLCRENHHLCIKYDSPRKITVDSVAVERFHMGLLAELFYERATRSFRVTKLKLAQYLDIYADPHEDAAYTTQLTTILAMFRFVNDIAPVIICEHLKMHYDVIINMATGPSDKAIHSIAEAKSLARCKAVAMKRLTDYNMLARLRREV